MGFLDGWQITPDTLITVWFGVQLMRILHQHDKRISNLEKEVDNGKNNGA